jgi:hypothetical protein
MPVAAERQPDAGASARPRKRATRMPVAEIVAISAPIPVSMPGLSSSVAHLPARFVASSASSARTDTAHIAHTAPPARTDRTDRALPRRPDVRQHFGELRTALADGWEIVQPIFARPLWSVTDDSTTAFNFVLRRERTTRLLTVPEGRTVERFIRERQLTVDYRR